MHWSSSRPWGHANSGYQARDASAAEESGVALAARASGAGGTTPARGEGNERESGGRKIERPTAMPVVVAGPGLLGCGGASPARPEPLARAGRRVTEALSERRSLTGDDVRALLAEELESWRF